ncbi:hypothetical protein MASR2M18_02490 [Ignavibacteria bacterium]|nr:tRNA pseudouridine(55) synthase TruB [Bacteroidota bacterium]MCZ2133090.1 tRNA pseudouridine(55) synthase TruB [Bacteroidota bacterium]
MNYTELPLLSRRISGDKVAEWHGAAASSGAAALIDKSSGWTSFDAVAKMRSLTHIKKIGHAGTLDPLATGLLILCFGKATKLIEQFQGLPKRYSAIVKLGAVTRTDDAEAPEENVRGTGDLSHQDITAVLKRFVGEIEQIPPIFSAIKSGGQPLYKAARKGQSVNPQPRTVHIYSIEPRNTDIPFIELEVYCSKGTYIRSLARDIGAALGCGGYLSSLRRSAVGDFLADDALTIVEMREVFTEQSVDR